MGLPRCASSSVTSLPSITNVYILDHKGGLQSLTCVLRAYGLCYLRPIHAVLVIHNNPPSGATPRVRKRNRQINIGIAKEQDKRKCPHSPQEWGWRAAGGGAVMN